LIKLKKLRILYAIQGTGNGHLSRATAFIPLLKERGDLDILVSGQDVNVTLDDPIKFRLTGAGFVFGKHGSFDWWQTLAIQRPWQLLRDSKFLPLKDYDLVLNDFEPVSALAARRQNYTRIVGLSHQASFLSPLTPRPAHQKAAHAEWLFRNYARCPRSLGLHFEAYDDFIYTPVIRPGIRALNPTQKHPEILVYLPAFGDELLIKFLQRYGPKQEWVIFSKRARHTTKDGLFTRHPASDGLFLQHLEHAAGVLCGAGFEAPAETLFLGKKLMVIPMKHQFEQACNAEALRRMGIPVGTGLDESTGIALRHWLTQETPPPRPWPDQNKLLLDLCFDISCQSQF
jgi:uncharacterized protein (TIGR00661 family)